MAYGRGTKSLSMQTGIGTLVDGEGTWGKAKGSAHSLPVCAMRGCGQMMSSTALVNFQISMGASMEENGHPVDVMDLG